MKTVAEKLAIKDAEVIALREQLSGISHLMKSIVEPVNEVIRISDRKHDAWDATKVALKKAKEMGY